MKKLFLLLLFWSYVIIAQTPDLLGLSSYDGYNGNGFVYTLQNGNIEHLYDFVSVDQKGRFPQYGLVEFNGEYYGVAYGGANAVGVIFKYNPGTQEVSSVYDFDRNSGYLPVSALTLYNDKLYGATSKGGASDTGTIFSFDPASGTYETLYEMGDDYVDGYKINGFIAGNDILYGVTRYGGNNTGGVLFSFDLNTNNYTVLHHFDMQAEGRVDRFTLPVLYNDVIYGVLYYKNKFYKYDLNTQTFSILHTFDSSAEYGPVGKLVADASGIYGITVKGGTANDGGIYKYDPVNNSMTILHTFDMVSPDWGGLIKSGDKLVGISNYNSNSPYGGVYTYDLNTGTYNDYLSFTNNRSAYNFLADEGNNKFLGLRVYAGSALAGEIFEADLSTDSYNVVFNFNVAPEGASPWGRLELADNGNFYGVTRGGGQNGSGVVYEISSSGNFQKIYDSSQPVTSSLLKATLYNDKVYVVEFDKIVGIDINTHQSNVEASLPSRTYMPLLPASNGKMYTLTFYGNMIEFDPATGNISEFPNSEIKYVSGELTEYNGKLYAMPHYYQNNTSNPYLGALVSFDLNTQTFAVESEFDSTTGTFATYSSSHNALTLLNDKLYGTTNIMGANDEGVLFVYDPATGNLSVLQDLMYDNVFGQKLLPVGNQTLLGTFGDKIVAFDLQTNTQQVIEDLSPEIYTSFSSLVDLSNTAVNDEMMSHFSVYPNPAVDFINIVSKDDKYAVQQITLTGTTGKQVLKTTQAGKIDVSRLPKGLYVLQVKLQNGSGFNKLILKK